jgi:hypothetical protein
MVECPDKEKAMHLLRHARSQAQAMVSSGKNKGKSISEVERFHFFTRIVIHQASTGCNGEGKVSHIHLVDLIGMAPNIEDDKSFSRMNYEDKEARRINSMQLLSFTKVLTEMKRLSTANASDPEDHLLNRLR